MMRLTRPIMLAAVAALALAGCEKKDDTATTPAAKEAAGDETLAKGIPADSKMGAALKAAGLDATLAGPGPYTVLVPDDAAFAKLPAGTLDNLMKPEARADLTALLTYHILPGTILAGDIGKAKIAKGDDKRSNGVIHQLDAVLMPS
jgi:uncharacterized surface protein with fasciclin (FAS1) repeats